MANSHDQSFASILLEKKCILQGISSSKKTQTHYCFIFLFWLTCHTLLLLYILVMVPKDSVGGVAAVLIFILIRHLFIYTVCTSGELETILFRMKCWGCQACCFDQTSLLSNFTGTAYGASNLKFESWVFNGKVAKCLRFLLKCTQY